MTSSRNVAERHGRLRRQSVPVQDTGLPVQDTGLPVQDTGLPVQDTGSPVQDTGLSVQDTGSPIDNAGAAAISDDTRRATLLKTFAVIGIVIAAALVVLAEIGRQLGFFASTRQARLTTLFPVVFVALSLIVLELVRREVASSESLARLYVWATCLIVVAAAAIFNGYLSATWLIVAWPIVLAGGLLRPVDSLVVGLGAFGVYVVVMILEILGLYDPPMPTAAGSFPFFALSFGWLMAIMVVALVTYLNGRSFLHIFRTLGRTSEDLELARRDLSQRVADRTAELEARAEQLRTIAELGQVATSMPVDNTGQETAALLSRAASLISERLGFYHVGIFLIDPSGQWAVLRAVSSEGGARMLARGHRLRIGQQGIVGYVAEMAVPRFAFNVGDDVVWFRNPDLPETQSEIALPLIVAERVIGVLDIQTQAPAAFTQDDVGTFRILADGLAIAIQNAQLLQETRETVARLERYQAEDAVRAWRQALSRRRRQVGYVYSDGAVEGSLSQVGQLDAHVGQVPGVKREMTDDGQHILLAPIHVSGMQLGLLSFESASRWPDEAVQLVETVVGQLDLALTNARLLEETRLRAAQEAARGEIVGRIRAMTSTDAILRHAAEELGRALQVERSRIQLVQVGEEGRGGQNHRLDGDEG